MQHRNRVSLDWDNAWRLDTGAADDHSDEVVGESEAIEVSVRFRARIPVRPVRLIADGFGLSRSEVEKLLAEGKIVSGIRLSSKLSGDFTFTLKR